MEKIPPIDIFDNDDIRAKLPLLEDYLKHQRRELDKLEATVDKLAAQAGVKRQRPVVKARRSSTKDLLVNGNERVTSRSQVREIIEGIGGPATVDEVVSKTDPPIKQKTVGWALWKESAEGNIKTVAKGIYAPLSYQPQELVPDTDERGDGS